MCNPDPIGSPMRHKPWREDLENLVVDLPDHNHTKGITSPPSETNNLQKHPNPAGVW